MRADVSPFAFTAVRAKVVFLVVLSKILVKVFLVVRRNITKRGGHDLKNDPIRECPKQTGRGRPRLGFFSLCWQRVHKW